MVKIELKLENYREEVKNYIEFLINELEKKEGILNESYTMPLTMLAENLETFYKAKEIVDREGITITGGRGLMIHPAQKVKDATEIRIEKMIDHFGLSPKASKKLEVEKDDFDDVLEEWVN